MGVAASPVPRIDHVVVIVMENKSEGQILRSPEAPTFRRLAERYALLGHYDAVAHPSLPNYLALVAGSTFGIRRDCIRCRIDAPTLADTLSQTGRSWKMYVEREAHPVHGPHRRSVLARLPFLFFGDSARTRRSTVGFPRLGRDLARGRLPSFSLVVPNLCHQMHDCSIAAGDRWLRATTNQLLASPTMRHGVVFVVFDEGRHRDRKGGGGHVLALALGPLVRRDVVSNQPLTHYSLLRTIEQAWDLPYLGQSAPATPIRGIWRAETPSRGSREKSRL